MQLLLCDPALLQRWVVQITDLQRCYTETVDAPHTCVESEIGNDSLEKCRKGAKFAAHTAFWAILGEISCLFSLALEFFTRFRGGSFQPLTHLSASEQQLVYAPYSLKKQVPRCSRNDKGIKRLGKRLTTSD